MDEIIQEGQENVDQKEEVVEEVVQEEKVEEVVEQTEEEKETERERNLKAENRRKAEELARLKEENERLRQHEPVSEVDNTEKTLLRMRDVELTALLNDPQYSNLHFRVREILDERRYDRYHARKEEQRARLDAEIELERKFPDVLNPAHPLALRTKELMRLKRLENHPQGRLIAAELAASELAREKAFSAGRKKEQNRQADVKANFQGESGRPAPKVSDKVKEEELKKRAMAGDETARQEWFKLRGLI